MEGRREGWEEHTRLMRLFQRARRAPNCLPGRTSRASNCCAARCLSVALSALVSLSCRVSAASSSRSAAWHFSPRCTAWRAAATASCAAPPDSPDSPAPSRAAIEGFVLVRPRRAASASSAAASLSAARLASASASERRSALFAARASARCRRDASSSRASCGASAAVTTAPPAEPGGAEREPRPMGLSSGDEAEGERWRGGEAPWPSAPSCSTSRAIASPSCARRRVHSSCSATCAASLHASACAASPARSSALAALTCTWGWPPSMHRKASSVIQRGCSPPAARAAG